VKSRPRANAASSSAEEEKGKDAAYPLHAGAATCKKKKKPAHFRTPHLRIKESLHEPGNRALAHSGASGGKKRAVKYFGNPYGHLCLPAPREGSTPNASARAQAGRTARGGDQEVRPERRKARVLTHNPGKDPRDLCENRLEVPALSSSKDLGREGTPCLPHGKNAPREGGPDRGLRLRKSASLENEGGGEKSGAHYFNRPIYERTNPAARRSRPQIIHQRRKRRRKSRPARKAPPMPSTNRPIDLSDRCLKVQRGEKGNSGRIACPSMHKKINIRGGGWIPESPIIMAGGGRRKGRKRRFTALGRTTPKTKDVVF